MPLGWVTAAGVELVIRVLDSIFWTMKTKLKFEMPDVPELR
jgi:hypothetical protein